MPPLKTPGFRSITQTGVMYVTSEANKQGFQRGDSEWANLGQGSPETGSIENGPERVQECHFEIEGQHYSPIGGNTELRQKVADYYNAIFRQGKKSKYTLENVSIAGGGRQSLSRLVATLGNINMGHFLPDYTAYEELLSSFKNFTPIPILLEKENNYHISIEMLKKEILGRGLRSLLISNPCNPTGQLIAGDELQAWITTAGECECSLIIDEFYSHYIYADQGEAVCNISSAAKHIDDVNSDPIIIVDGLTKNWRYPGWRISWTVGPKDVIQASCSAGSYLDGGANHPFQMHAKPLLSADHVCREAAAIQTLFSQKRQYAIERLRKMGIKVETEPMGGFYIWADLSGLPAPLNDAMKFFEAGLLEKVITVPGIFFDVNPGGRRIKHRRYSDHCRISFGPEMSVLTRGLDALERVIAKG